MARKSLAEVMINMFMLSLLQTREQLRALRAQKAAAAAAAPKPRPAAVAASPPPAAEVAPRLAQPEPDRRMPPPPPRPPGVRHWLHKQALSTALLAGEA